MQTFFKKEKNDAGFTLIEMMLALFIFVMVILIVANIFVVINNSQRRVATMQKLQDDVRYVFESMAQEIRLGGINYLFYQDPDEDGDYTDAIDLYPQPSSVNTVLAVTNQSGEQIFFRRSNDLGAVEYCKITNVTTDHCRLGTDYEGDWQDVTPQGVRVLYLRFDITPSADPFTDVSSLSCLSTNPCAGQCLSYRWDAGQSRCEYFSDGGNYQPKVKIVLTTEGTGTTVAEQSNLTMQTTVSSRLMSGKAENTFHD